MKYADEMDGIFRTLLFSFKNKFIIFLELMLFFSFKSFLAVYIFLNKTIDYLCVTWISIKNNVM